MSRGFRISMSGTASLRAKLGAASSLAMAAGKVAVVEQAESIMAKAKRLTPVDTGTLRSSGRVSAPKIGRDTVEVKLSFGGAAQEYALYVHEDLEVYHPTGQAKFLEQPVREASDAYGALVGRRVRSILRGL